MVNIVSAAGIKNFLQKFQLFAVLFFLMLFTLGIGSTIADVGAVVTLFADQFPKVPRWKITAIFCISAFLVGLVYVTPVCSESDALNLSFVSNTIRIQDTSCLI
jgi:SNF family Na+-dependent transporter